MQLEDLDYDTARGDAVAEGEGSLRADITILTLDAAAAEALLGIDDPYDIEPRRFKRPMGEVAAANARARDGCEVLSQPSFWATEGEHALEFEREIKQGDNAMTEGVRGKLRLFDNGDGGISITADCHVAFTATATRTTLGEDGVEISNERTRLVQLHRVAVETIIPGETAMYQLARTSRDGKDYCHLLFIRLTAVETDN
jgi:hypothetical protein